MSIVHRLVFGAVVGLFIHTAAADSLPRALGGPAFSDPGRVVELGEAWRERPVRRLGWADGAELAVTLDQHLYPALLPLIQEYARAQGVDIAVQEGTCGISAGKLAEREADVGGFCCPAGEGDRLPGMRFHTLGIASLALLVHPGNPVSALSLEGARGIFAGRTGYWREIDRDARAQGAIRPVGRLHCKARPGHWRLLLDNEDHFSPRLYEVSTIPDMISAVSGSRGAIGYEVLWMAERHAKLGRVKMLDVAGSAPSDREALVSGRYPLYRTYQITTWSDPAARSEVAEALVAFLVVNSHRIDPRYGIVPVARLREAGWRFQDDELVGEPAS